MFGSYLLGSFDLKHNLIFHFIIEFLSGLSAIADGGW
jgi:hypothetical protein